jgi:hypothetical protein
MSDLKQQHRNSSNSLSPPLPDRGSPGVHTNSVRVLETGSPGTTIWDLFYSAIRIGSIDRQKLSRVATTPADYLRFEKWVEHCRVMGSPRTDIVLVFVKSNVFRALMSNETDLGTSDKDIMDDNAQSPYSNTC